MLQKLRDPVGELVVSMKSGLRDRNNERSPACRTRIRPGVSMKSGLRDRNNPYGEVAYVDTVSLRLNEVRP